MIKANIKQSTVTQYLFVFSLICIFMLTFSHVLSKDWHLIFKKSLYHHDETVQSVVSANLTRRIFPAMVRVNPLVESQKIIRKNDRLKSIWMEGPYWQHIPPLFAYVPLPLFALDNQVTIEIKRLSYALVMLLTGIIFIFTVYAFTKTLVGAISATLAVVLWVYTPFSRGLITGRNFGNSDIVLSFTVICSFAMLCWYLSRSAQLRKNYSYLRLILSAVVVSLPIMTKNALGAIPAATFFTLLLYDHRKVTLKWVVSFSSFLTCLLCYYGTLYLSSPETFRYEILVSLHHVSGSYEGWGRPWHFFVTHYLPAYYLKNYSSLYLGAILLGLFVLLVGGCREKNRTILSLSLIWFLWNLTAISLTRAKVPNFIYQTYLLSLFFGIHALLLVAVQSAVFEPLSSKLKRVFTSKISLYSAACLSLGLAFFTTRAYGGLIDKIPETRKLKYNYESPREKFYHFGEIARENGANTRDIFLLDDTEKGYWFKYYILFLTGAEAVNLYDVVPLDVSLDSLRKKYARTHFVFDQTRNIPEVFAAYKNSAFPYFPVISFDLKSADFARLREDLSSLIRQASANKNTFDLYELKNNYSYVKIIAPEAYHYLNEKCRSSLSQFRKVFHINSYVTLIAYRYRRLALKQYEFSFLFKVNQPLERGWKMCLLGHVKEQHLKRLSQEERKSQSKIWWLEPIPPIYDWPADECILITETIEAEPISYNLKIGFYESRENIADLVDLGWVDLDERSSAPVPP